MKIDGAPIVTTEFVAGLRRQTEWSTLIAAAFFFGKIGAGLFTVGLFLDSPLSAALGLLIAVVGKGVAHLLYLGRPERFWRAVARPRRSWIARGLLAMLGFAVFGSLVVAAGLGWAGGVLAPGSLLGVTVAGLALSSALVLMIYDGFVLAVPPSIALWHTPLMPVLCLFYSLLGGLTLGTLILHLTGATGVPDLLKPLEIAIIGLNLFMVLVYLSVMQGGGPAAREAVRSLLTGRFALVFVGGAIVVGLLASLVLAVYFAATGQLAALVGLAGADLVGHFLIFYALLKSALFRPVY